MHIMQHIGTVAPVQLGDIIGTMLPSMKGTTLSISTLKIFPIKH